MSSEEKQQSRAEASATQSSSGTHRRSVSAAASPPRASSISGGGRYTGTEQASGASSTVQDPPAESEDRFLDVPSTRHRAVTASPSSQSQSSASGAAEDSSAKSSRSVSPRGDGVGGVISPPHAGHARRSSFTLQASSPSAPAVPIQLSRKESVFKTKTPAPISPAARNNNANTNASAVAAASNATTTEQQHSHSLPPRSPAHKQLHSPVSPGPASNPPLQSSISAEQAAAVQQASEAAAAALASIQGDRASASASTATPAAAPAAVATLSAENASSIAMVFSAMAGGRRPTVSGRGDASASSSSFSAGGSGAGEYKPIYNENGVELEQPIVINPRTGKPKVKRVFARRYASLILAHVARENAAAATREALEYRERKKKHLESTQEKHASALAWAFVARKEKSRLHGKKISVADYFSQVMISLAASDETRKAEEKRLKEELHAREERIRALLGEDPTAKAGALGNAEGGDNSSQIEALHKSGNIFNAVLNADRKQVDALLRANPHILSQRGPVGELPLHMAFLYNSPAHHVLAFYLMSLCPHLIAEQYQGSEYTGENILHIAIIQQELRLVERLVAKEPALLLARATGRFFSQGNPCYYGEWPLSFAACTGQTSMVELLIAAGADMEAVDSNGNNALHLMIIHKRTEMYTLIKEKWIVLNAAREPGLRCSNDRLLWKRRNKEGFTPMTLSAKLGSIEMFSFLLEEEKQMQWSYGPISCFVYPLEQIDMPLAVTQQEKAQARKAAAAAAAAESSGGSGSHSPSDDEDEDSLLAQMQPRALELIVNEAHLDLLMHPRMIELIKQKWSRFAQRIFFQRFMIVLVYLALFTTCCIHRQTENIRGIETWGVFEDHLMIYKNQSEHYAHLEKEREEILANVEIHAIEILESARVEYERNITKKKILSSKNSSGSKTNATAAAAAAAGIVIDATPPLPSAVDPSSFGSTADPAFNSSSSSSSSDDDLSPPSLELIRSELLRKLALPRIPHVVHLEGLDVDRLERLIARENEKASSRESAGIAKRKRREADLADGEFGEGMHIDISSMSPSELSELLTPPPMLYDDGVLGGLFDLLCELIWNPPINWGEILWKYPVALLAGEIIVVAGALYKGNNELGELHSRGINNYFGAAGSAFFENTLSLLFASLMSIVLILSMLGSYQVRMVMGLCSMVGYSYIFFFLLAFRMTGPMIVMIYQMLTSDVFRFLTVFSVFLIAFAQAFFVLFDADGFSGFIQSIQACFLAMLGDFEVEEYYAAASNFKMISVGMLVTYVVVVTILLLNLLIAMMGSTYNKINEAAEMQWHLERARIVFAIEHEMGEDERGAKANKYWTVIGGKRFLQVMVEDPSHFRKRKNEITAAPTAAESSSEEKKTEEKSTPQKAAATAASASSSSSSSSAAPKAS